jgi:hypothetical protein
MDFAPDRDDGSVEVFLLLVLTGIIIGMPLRLPAN